jgi:hypothetical protein
MVLPGRFAHDGVMKTSIQLIIGAGLAFFGIIPGATASAIHDFNVYVTSAAQAPNGGFWIQVNDTATGGRTLPPAAPPCMRT